MADRILWYAIDCIFLGLLRTVYDMDIQPNSQAISRSIWIVKVHPGGMSLKWVV